MTSSTTLPPFSDVSLLEIFRSLPLSQLFHELPLVHPRWDLLSASKLQPKQHLVLYLGEQVDRLFTAETGNYPFPYASEVVASDGGALFPSPNNSSPHDKLSLASLEPSTVSRLGTLMPSISSLSVAIHKAPLSTLTHLSRLLEHWSASLQTFALLYDPSDKINSPEGSEEQLHRLASTLNSLPLLQDLTLDLRHYQPFRSPLDLPIIRRLKVFHFHLPNCAIFEPSSSYEDRPNFWKIINQYLEENNNPFAVCLFFRQWYLHNFFEQHLPLASKLVNVAEGDSPFNNRLKFPNILKGKERLFTRLQAGEMWPICPEDHLARLSATCTSFANLQYLSLVYHFTTQKLLSSPEGATHYSLVSVKVLQIRGFTYTHTVLESPHWSVVFPSVQILHLLPHYAFQREMQWQRRCSCFPVRSVLFRLVSAEEKARVLGPCVRKLLAPFSQCSATLKKAIVEGIYSLKRRSGRIFHNEYSLQFTGQELASPLI